MTTFAYLWAVVHEALASARAQKVATGVTVGVVAAMCMAVLLTTGRTVATEEVVLRSFDSLETRTLTVVAEPMAGVRAGFVDRVEKISHVEWVGAFGPAVDVTNVGAPRDWLASRNLYTHHPEVLGIAGSAMGDAWASPRALEHLGMPGASGGLVTASGREFPVVGRLAVPAFASRLEPLVVRPHASTGDEPIAIAIVVADAPEHVGVVAEAVRAVLGAADPNKVSVNTSENIAALRTVVQGELAVQSRQLVLLVFGATALLVALLLYGLVLFRRKDFGRRRALGATQGLIVFLVLLQTALTSALGATIGMALGYAVLAAQKVPLPSPTFAIAVEVLAILTATVAALVPAMAAARRDPLVELRVP